MQLKLFWSFFATCPAWSVADIANQFLFPQPVNSPTQLQTFAEGIQVFLAWTANLNSTYDVNLWQLNSPNPETIFADSTDYGNVARTWNVSTKQDLSKKVFFFSIIATNGDGVGFNSQDFNILTGAQPGVSDASTVSTISDGQRQATTPEPITSGEKALSTASSVPQVSDAQPQSSVPGPVKTSGGMTGTSTSAAAEAPIQSGLSPGASVGIGLGGGIAACFLVCSLIGWWLIL